MLKYLKNVATLKLDQNKCTGCGRCMEVCPHGVFAVDEHLQRDEGRPKVRIAELDRCLECGACMRNCAFSAIDVRSGVG